jgi:hypothetical protein
MLLCDTLEEGGGGGQDANNNNKKKSEEEEEEKTRCRYSTRTQHRATEVCNMTRLRGNSRTRRGRLASPSVPYSLVCVYYYLIFFFSPIYLYPTWILFTAECYSSLFSICFQVCLLVYTHNNRAPRKTHNNIRNHFFFHFLSYAPLSLRIPDGPRVERLFKLEIIGP